MINIASNYNSEALIYSIDLPNKLRSKNCGLIVDYQRVSELFELYLGSANGLGDSFLETLEWQKQLTEEVVDAVDDERLGTGQREIDQRLMGRPRLPHFILAVLVNQLLHNVRNSTTFFPTSTRTTLQFTVYALAVRRRRWQYRLSFFHEAIYYYFIHGAQLSQRDRAMLSVIKYFAVTQGHPRSFETTPLSRACVTSSLLVVLCIELCLYVVPFLRHSASNNCATLKSQLRVVLPL